MVSAESAASTRCIASTWPAPGCVVPGGMPTQANSPNGPRPSPVSSCLPRAQYLIMLWVRAGHLVRPQVGGSVGGSGSLSEGSSVAGFLRVGVVQHEADVVLLGSCCVHWWARGATMGVM